MQTPRGVADQELNVAFVGSGISVITKCSWIRVVFTGNNIDLETVGPDLELFDSGSSKRIGSGQHYGVPVLLEKVG